MSKKWFRVLFRRRVLVILLMLVQVFFLIYVLNSGSKVSTVINLTLTTISFLVTLHIISQKEKGSYKLIWVILILLFPVFGGLFYLLCNFQSSTKRFGTKIAQIEKKSKMLWILPGDGFVEAAATLPQRLPQLQYLQQFSGFPIYTDTQARYLTPGERKWEMLLKELEKAGEYIFLEYFIVQEGVMWNAILEVLKRKASQGVLVRLMYDDIGCFFMLPKDYPEQMKKFGIECVIFNPFRPLATVVQNNRDHRKIAVIDGKVAFTGGINLADEYINAYEKHGHWKDSAVMVQGKAAWAFTLMFLQMWELVTGLDEDYTRYYPWGDTPCPEVQDGFAQPYADSPMDKENVGEHVYLQIINNAKQYVYITTPYLIVDDSVISALCLAAKSGVDVRIVTPHIWDKKAVHITTRSYYRELIAAGVRVYEYSKGFIHSKTFVSDDEMATVGTTNLDFRSLYLHFECGVCLYRSAAVMEVKEDFLNTLNVCQEIELEECNGGLLLRFAQNVLRLFAPLM
ncbi:MAG: cardiolipin synthase [Lachnospiraceae bacterium]|nr:cardiolipin synthase [Lachnospiraceae bacterium]